MPRPPGRIDERIGAIDHLLLALEHVLGDDQLGDRPVADLALQQPGRDQADDLAAGGHRGVGHCAHQADWPPP